MKVTHGSAVVVVCVEGDASFGVSVGLGGMGAGEGMEAGEREWGQIRWGFAVWHEMCTWRVV